MLGETRWGGWGSTEDLDLPIELGDFHLLGLDLTLELPDLAVLGPHGDSHRSDLIWQAVLR